VILTAVGILTFIMVAIIPKFKKIFDDFQMKLPWATETLIQTSMWFADYWWVLPLFPMGFFILVKLIRLSKAGSYAVDRVKLWIPLMGKILEKSIVARTMRTLGTLVASGVPILEALSIVRETSNNVVFERMFSRVIESIREGDTIADPLKQSRLVDDMVTNMVEVGEETGDLDTMLFKIADFYDEEVDTAVKGLISALEPLMIVVLGLIIGAIVISLFLPLIRLLEGLSK
jgi:type IV pilus assembly protein PilC